MALTPSEAVMDWPRRVAAAEAAARAGRPALAVTELRPALTGRGAPVEALRGLMAVASAAGDRDTACAAAHRLTQLNPGSAVAEHNLAARLGEAGRMADSEAAARRAFAKGGKAPETWLVLARALQGQGRLDDADTAFATALRLRPTYLDAWRDRAQLAWMRSTDPAQVLAILQPLRVAAGGDPTAMAFLANVLRQTVGPRAAYDSLQAWRGPPSAMLEFAAATAAANFDMTTALQRHRSAVALAPTDPAMRLGWCGALIATGGAEEAERGLQDHLLRDPDDRYARGLLEMARRELQRPEALTGADYGRRVRSSRLGEGLGDQRSDWLARVAAALRALHPFQGHPFDQSVLNGAQSAIDPRAAGNPDIDLLFREISTAVDAYIADAGERKPWRIDGAWSVRLREGGRHVDHVHPKGWISSAVYIDLPPAIGGGAREGWLRFGAGRFGLFQQPALHWVQPEPGNLVLFPSEFWHGTEPFKGGGDRLTVAFDVVPA